MEDQSVSLGIVLILGFDTEQIQLNESWIAGMFENTWSNENIGISAKIVYLGDGSVRFHVNASPVKALFSYAIVAAIFNFIIAVQAIGFLVITVPLSLAMLLIRINSYGASPTQDILLVPNFVTPAVSKSAQERTISMDSMCALLVRENVNRQDDPAFIQLYLVSTSGNCLLVLQDYLFRKKSFLERVYELHGFLNNARKKQANC